MRWRFTCSRAEANDRQATRHAPRDEPHAEREEYIAFRAQLIVWSTATMRRIIYNALGCGLAWGLGGYILELNSKPLTIHTPWVIGIPLTLVALFAAWGAILPLIVLHSQLISKIVIVAVASTCVSILGIICWAFLSAGIVKDIPDAGRDSLGNWRIMGFLFFGSLGSCLGVLQAALVAWLAKWESAAEAPRTPKRAD